MEKKYTPLSDADVRQHIKTVILYTKFITMSTAEIIEALPIVILYETAPHTGHWVLLHKVEGDQLEFFDSYSFKPDEEFMLIKPELQLPHKMVKFLKEMCKHHTINYNPYHFQDITDSKTATCGRWCILRERIGGSIDTFALRIAKDCEKRGITPDDLVSLLV